MEISGVTYRFVFMSNTKFFGYKEITIDGSQVNISNLKKPLWIALTEFVIPEAYLKWRRRFGYGQNELDFTKMAEYSMRNGNKAASQRLGYLIETLGFSG